ncbi:hypothetical protein [Pseudomonas syringae]|uniref:Uncharacterized protein n=1 Tax=Pseudomonas syringae CC1417 TaxID=1357272 RepID=A0AAU8LF36_PSESX
MSNQKIREEFEAAFISQQVEVFGENYRSGAVYRLKRDGDFEKPPTAYELQRRKQGMYDDYWIEMLWWAWQASRESLLKKQAQEQEDFLAHLADFEPEDTLHD